MPGSRLSIPARSGLRVLTRALTPAVMERLDDTLVEALRDPSACGPVVETGHGRSRASSIGDALGGLGVRQEGFRKMGAQFCTGQHAQDSLQHAAVLCSC